MAAAEYFSNAPMVASAPSPQPPTTRPPQISQPPTSHPNSSTPQLQHAFQAAPQYQEQRPGVHFAPAPIDINKPQRHSFSSPRPPQNIWNQSPNSHSPNHHAMQLRPQQPYGTPPSAGYHSPSQRPQHLSPHMRPYINPNSSHYSLESGGYSSDPEPRRRKHKHRRQTDSRESRSPKTSSRSTHSDAFLGAASGGIIGDLIFPGLGTVGGAAIGWLGGKDYGNHRKHREEKRAEEQRKWEEKFRPDSRRRSGSREYSSRGSSTHQRDR